MKKAIQIPPNVSIQILIPLISNKVIIIDTTTV